MGRKSNEQKSREKLEIAEKLFHRCITASARNRQLQVDDQRFAAADPDNSWQWPAQVLTQRNADPNGPRPCLTINKLPQHIRQVTNDQRQNRPSIKVIPVDSGADPKTAEVLNGMIRHIQYASNADVAYDTACESQVTHGEGYIRVITDYIDDKSFDQEIFIRRVKNPLSVYMDPDINMPDGSDAKFCFVNDSLTREEFEQEYPGVDPMSWRMTAQGDAVKLWADGEKIRVCEWWQVEEEKADLLMWEDGTTTFHDDDRPAHMPAIALPTRTREVNRRIVMFRKLYGGGVLEEQRWPGRYIPIARVVGNEYWIEGEVFISGIVRNAKDAQRQYNYAASLEVETYALGPKAPWIGAAGQFEGHEQKWRNANTTNYAYLEYNATTDETGGAMLPAPQRVAPPIPNMAIQQLKANAADDIKSTTAQYDASLGARGNETSGRAIVARQRESDTATYHYIDNLSRAISYIGKIIVDLIPKIYDTRRVVRILGEDQEPGQATIDPKAQQSFSEVPDDQGGIKQMLFNPSIGRYDVMVTTGPSYNTKRQEFADFAQQFAQGNPQLMQIIGDLFFKALDVPYADEMADRMKKMLPPQLQGGEDGQPQIPPQIQQKMAQMQQAGQQMQQVIQQLGQKLQQAQQDAQNKDADYQTRLAETQMKIQSQERIAMANNETKKDVEEIKQAVLLLSKQMIPPPALAQASQEALTEPQAE